MSTTAIAPKQSNDVRALLAKPETIKELGRVATKHLTADRLARLVLSACARVPKLLECTPQSVLTCAMTCSQYGVEPDGRHAHLIPYGNQCTLIIDWKGLVALGRRAGVEGIVADTICERDEFIYYRDEQGTHFKHVPKFGDRGEIIGAYSTARIAGQFDVEVMTSDEIEGIRKRSKAGNSGPWVSDFGEMAKKTAIRRHSKRWPLSEDVAGAFLADDDVPADLGRGPEIRKPLFAPTVEVSVAPAEEPAQVEAPRQKRTYTRRQPAVETSPATEPQPTDAAEAPSEPVEAPEPPSAETVQGILAAFVIGECESEWKYFAEAVINLQLARGAQVDLWTGFQDVPSSVANAALNQKAKLKTQLELEALK